MMERGFYHPDHGYWQTIGEPSEAILATYPEGTIEVPLKPGADYEWQNGAWVHVPPPEPVLDVVSPLQARVALMQVGKLEAVEQVVAGAGPLVQVAWEYATELRRHSPTIEMLREQAGWSPEEMDALFIAAAQVEF